MEAYVKHRRLLLHKDKRRKDSLPKPPSSPVPSSAPSQPIPLSAFVNDRIGNKLAALSSSFGQKLESLTSVLLSKILLLQAPTESHMSARMSNPSSTAPPAVPALCPSPGLDLPPLNPEGTVGFHRQFLGERVGPVPSGSRVPFPLDQVYVVRDSGYVLSVDVQVPPAVAEVPAQVGAASLVFTDRRLPPAVAEASTLAHPSASAVSTSTHIRSPFAEAQAPPTAASAHPPVRFADPPVAGPSAPEQAEEEDEDGASVVSNSLVVDRTVARLASFIHDSYPESCLLSASPLASRCGFESLYALAEPSESTRPRFCLYLRVDEIMTDVCDRAAVIAKGTKPLSAILPKHRRSHLVADVADFTAPLAINSDFLQLAENKSISTKRLGTVLFFGLEWMKSSMKSLLEANSYLLWLLSGLLSQLKRDGFAPSDSAISSLSASLRRQTRTAILLSDFIVSKRRESYLGHASLPLSASQKRELLISLGLESSLFDQGLLEKVSG